MADMGMAPMTSTSKLIDQGNGVYAGEVELGSGGTWQVTITAEQAGNTLLTKHLTLNATGGM
jgi:Cu(I)/Ag(I) efflux system membrane fusion protein/cobalt-zinc-cadmium efflux system membrane fusion protein